MQSKLPQPAVDASKPIPETSLSPTEMAIHLERMKTIDQAITKDELIERVNRRLRKEAE